MVANKTNFDKTEKIDNRKKVTLKTSTAKGLGLFSMIGIIMGAVIGTGIFFKNVSVFQNNNNNAIGVIISWTVVLLLVLATAFSYGEIVKCKTKSGNSGLAGWCERYVGYNFGRFVKVVQPIFYYSIFMLVLPVFVAEAIFNVNPGYRSGGITANFWFVILIALTITIAIITLNMFTNTVTPKMSSYIMIIKFIPLTLVIIMGIIVGVMHPESSLFKEAITNDPKPTKQLSFTGILNSLPAIMFAFDSFLIIGNVAKSAKKPTTDIPLSIIIATVLSGGFYLLITLAQIFVGTGNPYDTIEKCGLTGSALTTVSIIFSLLLVATVFGGANAIMMGGCRSIQSAIDEEVLVGSKTIKKWSNGRGGNYFGGGIVALIMVAIGVFAVFIPSGYLQSDVLFDGMSNVVVVLFFGIYGIVPLASVINRKTNKVPTSEVPRQKGQIPAAIVGGLGCLFIAGYCMFYQFGYSAIINSKEVLKWGLFYNNQYKISAGVGAAVFWGLTAMFFVFPFLHDLIIKQTNKSYDQKLLWQKAN